jgi:protein suppressor of PHYA-105 1
MPEVNGIQLLHYVKGEHALRAVPVVMMSSVDQGETVYECVQGGAEEYLVKPVTRKEVQHIWQHVLRKRTAEAAVPQAAAAAAAAAAAPPQAAPAPAPPEPRESQHEDSAASARPAAAAPPPPPPPPGLPRPALAAPDYASASHVLKLMREARLAQLEDVETQARALEEDAAAVAAALAQAGAVAVAPAAKRQRTAGAGREGVLAGRAADLDALYFGRRAEAARGAHLGSFARDLDLLAHGSRLVCKAAVRCGDLATPSEMVSARAGVLGRPNTKRPGFAPRPCGWRKLAKLSPFYSWMCDRSGVQILPSPRPLHCGRFARGRGTGVARSLRMMLLPLLALILTPRPPQVCSADFDADDRHFATVSVSRCLKVFDLAAVLASPGALHFPAWQAATRSKLSCVSWSAYVRPHLITSDYDGLVQLWDASAGPGAEAAQFDEHARRVWSVDFSRVDPLRFVSGSDDGSVRLWSVNQPRSAARMLAPANVCSVHCSPADGNLVAAGCANHRVYLFDLRRPSEPAAVIAGPSRAVSYVRFVGGRALAAASTDSAVRLWRLDDALAAGAGAGAGAGAPPPQPLCTFTGHANERNFVGLAATDDGYLACGSEDDSVHAYYHSIPFAVTTHSFAADGAADEAAAAGRAGAGAAPPRASRPGHFVSAVAWARGGRHCLAANSGGLMRVLKLE